MNRLAMNYAYLIVQLLKKSGIPYTEIALGSGVSYSKVIQIANWERSSIMFDVVDRLEEYALSTIGGTKK